MIEYRELVDAGRKYLESKSYARAEQCFQKILKSGARYADVLNMLGVIYHIEGKFNNAIESFQEAVDINPNYVEASLNLAILYNDLGEYKKAKELYGRLQKRQTSNDLDPVVKAKLANMHAMIGDTYRKAGRFAEAIEEYKQALKLCPTFADIRTKLGLSYRDNKQKELSLKELAATVENHPQYKTARLQLGVTYYAMGKKKEAAKVWKELLAKDKDNRIAEIYLKLCDNGDSGSLSRKKSHHTP